MISYLLDFALVVALVVTAFRCTRMQRELRTLRSSESALSASLAQADASITRAAEVVVGLKHEGVETLRRLEFRIAEADDATDRLERLIVEADAVRRPAASIASCRRQANGPIAGFTPVWPAKSD